MKKNKTNLPSNPNTCCEVAEAAHFITFSRAAFPRRGGNVQRELHESRLGIYKPGKMHLIGNSSFFCKCDECGFQTYWNLTLSSKVQTV